MSERRKLYVTQRGFFEKGKLLCVTSAISGGAPTKWVGAEAKTCSEPVEPMPLKGHFAHPYPVICSLRIREKIRPVRLGIINNDGIRS
ncbi:MAG: hypothetical protein AB1422_12960 [bacterium]